MTQFTEGQDVEVEGIWFKPGQTSQEVGWRKAKILYPSDGIIDQGWQVAFPDGTRAVFDEAHIRAAPLQRPDRTDSGDFLYEPE